MKIKSLKVENFKVIDNIEIPNISENIVIFLGQNEIGKTTLGEVLRFIFFEFIEKNKDYIARYKPIGTNTIPSIKIEFEYKNEKNEVSHWKLSINKNASLYYLKDKEFKVQADSYDRCKEELKKMFEDIAIFKDILIQTQNENWNLKEKEWTLKGERQFLELISTVTFQQLTNIKEELHKELENNKYFTDEFKCYSTDKKSTLYSQYKNDIENLEKKLKQKEENIDVKLLEKELNKLKKNLDACEEEMSKAYINYKKIKEDFDKTIEVEKLESRIKETENNIKFLKLIIHTFNNAQKNEKDIEKNISELEKQINNAQDQLPSLEEDLKTTENEKKYFEQIKKLKECLEVSEKIKELRKQKENLDGLQKKKKYYEDLKKIKIAKNILSQYEKRCELEEQIKNHPEKQDVDNLSKLDKEITSIRSKLEKVHLEITPFNKIQAEISCDDESETITLNNTIKKQFSLKSIIKIPNFLTINIEKENAYILIQKLKEKDQEYKNILDKFKVNDSSQLTELYKEKYEKQSDINKINEDIKKELRIAGFDNIQDVKNFILSFPNDFIKSAEFETLENLKVLLEKETIETTKLNEYILHEEKNIEKNMKDIAMNEKEIEEYIKKFFPDDVEKAKQMSQMEIHNNITKIQTKIGEKKEKISKLKNSVNELSEYKERLEKQIPNAKKSKGNCLDEVNKKFTNELKEYNCIEVTNENFACVCKKIHSKLIERNNELKSKLPSNFNRVTKEERNKVEENKSKTETIFQRLKEEYNKKESEYLKYIEQTEENNKLESILKEKKIKFIDKLNEVIANYLAFRGVELLIEENKKDIKDALAKFTNDIKNDFLEITGQRYKEVKVNIKDDKMNIEKIIAHHPLKEVSFNIKELSCGTQEQLVTILRLIISHYISQKKPIFIFLDEPFANTDKERMAKLLEKILSRSKSQQDCQIIITTCKEDDAKYIQELAQRKGASAKIIDMKEVTARKNTIS